MLTWVITRYWQQHRQIKVILHKYWYFLSMDTILAPFVLTQPLITYRRAPSLRDKLVHSKYQTNKHDSGKPTGTFRRGNCNYCQDMNTGKNISLPNVEKFRSRHFVNCCSAGVMYLLQCECNCYYVGKMKLEIWRRIYRHIASFKKKDPGLLLRRHSRIVHFDYTPKVRFLALDQIPSNPRGGDLNK